MNVTDNALDLLRKRYFLEGETKPEQMFRRVAKCIAEAENKNERQEWEDKFYQELDEMNFMPNSPLIMNAGTSMKQYSACYVLPVHDSIESIYKMYSDAAIISKTGGGTGFDFSEIRPKGDRVGSTAGTASGVLSWMRIQNASTDEVKQGGRRRGANMGILKISHPEIEDFICAKDDGVSFTNFNFSVAITDDFMQAVKDDGDWDLTFKNKVYKTVKARYLWNMIAEHAWRSGEPGLVYIDSVNKGNPAPWLGEICATNPCLHKDTYLFTENGFEKISLLKSRIWNGYDFTDANSWKTGIKKIYRIMTNSGYEYFSTGDHKFKLVDGSWCEALNLIGKEVLVDYSEKEWVGTNPYPGTDYRVLGFELGDGTYHKASKRMKYIYITPEKDDDVADLISNVFQTEVSSVDKSGKLIINIPYGTIYADAFIGRIEDRMIPDWVMSLPKQEMKDFLQGLFSANGCNLKKYRKIQLVSINKEMLQQVQQMLLLFGIKSKLWYHNKPHDVEFSNGTYSCKQSLHLVISRESYKKYLDSIGFIQGYKNGYDNSLKFKPEENETVILISELDDDEVWDFSEPITNQGLTNGAFVHNCGEQPLLPYESCCLASINLLNFIDENKKITWDKLKTTTQIATRFLDNLIEVSEFPIPEIENTVKSNRKIGLGIMGLADMLYSLGIPYDSDKGVQIASRTMQFISDNATEYSLYLGEIRGPYPSAPNHDKRRNSALTSIQPTGSVSMIPNVTGGCEPGFLLIYNRYSESLDQNFMIIDRVLESELKKRGLYTDEILDKIIQNCGKVRGLKEIPKDMQKVFVTADDVSPEWHVRMQAALQNSGVEAGISKTINAPNSHTVEDVKNAYQLAYDLGCKGVTYYRSGSRDSQPLNAVGVSKNNQNEPKYVPVRPAIEEAMSKFKKLKTGCGSARLFFVQDEDGTLREVFTEASGGGCQASTETISRLTSLLLRANVDPDMIMDQLSSARCKTSIDNVKCKSCGDVIAKEIKRFIQQNTKIIEKPKEVNMVQQSQECTHPRMQKSEGCNICPDCGFSKCS